MSQHRLQIRTASLLSYLLQLISSMLCHDLKLFSSSSIEMTHYDKYIPKLFNEATKVLFLFCIHLGLAFLVLEAYLQNNYFSLYT